MTTPNVPARMAEAIERSVMPDSPYDEAQEAAHAALSVLDSDDVTEAIAQVLCNSFWSWTLTRDEDKAAFRRDARAVVALLKGEQP